MDLRIMFVCVLGVTLFHLSYGFAGYGQNAALSYGWGKRGVLDREIKQLTKPKVAPANVPSPDFKCDCSNLIARGQPMCARSMRPYVLVCKLAAPIKEIQQGGLTEDVCPCQLLKMKY